jgi:hypothetical protein
LERLLDVADEYAGRARVLREKMTEQGADAEALKEVDLLCRYFDTTAGLIAQETGDAEGDTAPPTGRGHGLGEAEEGPAVSDSDPVTVADLRGAIHELVVRIDAKLLAHRQAFQLLVQFQSETAGEDLAPQIQTRLDALRQATLATGEEGEAFRLMVASEFADLIEALEP